MLYTIPRVIISIAILILALIILKKVDKFKKGYIIISIISYFFVQSLLFLFPFENLFITFDTPENAFNYNHRGEISDVTEGNDSCIITYEGIGTEMERVIIPKTSKGYKIGTNFSKKVVYSKGINGKIVAIYSNISLTDYYTTVLDHITESDFKIYDSSNSTFKIFYEHISGTNVKVVLCNAFVDDMPDDYYVNVSEW